ncbi:MAG: DJ-1/PfpI family protein [Opitutales bacterium]
MKKLIYIIFDDFEEIESIVPIDLLRRAGASVEVLTLNLSRETRGRSNIKVLADNTLKAFSGDFDMLAISGGAGVFNAINNAEFLNLIAKANLENKEIAAICAAPIILKSVGLLDGKKCTGHTSIIDKLGANYVDEPCVKDGNITTSQGAGTVFDFAFSLINTLFGDAKSKEVAQSICYKGDI